MENPIENPVVLSRTAPRWMQNIIARALEHWEGLVNRLKALEFGADADQEKKWVLWEKT